MEGGLNFVLVSHYPTLLEKKVNSTKLSVF